jgi:hypothetical protein
MRESAHLHMQQVGLQVFGVPRLQPHLGVGGVQREDTVSYLRTPHAGVDVSTHAERPLSLYTVQPQRARGEHDVPCCGSVRIQ